MYHVFFVLFFYLEGGGGGGGVDYISLEQVY